MRELSPRHAWRICTFLTGIGFAATAYLTGRVLDLAASRGPGAPDLCSALFASSCDGALGDERFWILGVPLAGWGLVYFTALGGLLFLARFTKGAFEAEALLAGTLVTLSGTAVGIALSAWMLLGHAPLCPLCLAVHAISVLLLLALRRASPGPFAAQLRRVRGAWRWLVGAAETPEPVRWKLVGFASVALLAALAYQWVYVESALRRPQQAPAPDRAALIAAHRGSPRLDIPVAQDDPHLGPLTAPVTLVVFESFRCAGCRRFASTLARLRDRFGDRLLIVYKHYPLSTTCNGRLSRDLQPGACEIAWAAEAARRQGRFWPFYQAQFAAGGPPDGSVAEAGRRLKLDLARFDADRQSDSTRARVAADIAIGDRLKIPGTPAVFLDGRLVSPARPEILEILIRDALGHRDAGSPRRGRAITDVGRPVKEDRPSEGG